MVEDDALQKKLVIDDRAKLLALAQEAVLHIADQDNRDVVIHDLDTI